MRLHRDRPTPRFLGTLTLPDAQPLTIFTPYDDEPVEGCIRIDDLRKWTHDLSHAAEELGCSVYIAIPSGFVNLVPGPEAEYELIRQLEMAARRLQYAEGFTELSALLTRAAKHIRGEP